MSWCSLILNIYFYLLISVLWVNRSKFSVVNLLYQDLTEPGLKPISAIGLTPFDAKKTNSPSCHKDPRQEICAFQVSEVAMTINGSGTKEIIEIAAVQWQAISSGYLLDSEAIKLMDVQTYTLFIFSEFCVITQMDINGISFFSLCTHRFVLKSLCLWKVFSIKRKLPVF